MNIFPLTVVVVFSFAIARLPAVAQNADAKASRLQKFAEQWLAKIKELVTEYRSFGLGVPYGIGGLTLVWGYVISVFR